MIEADVTELIDDNSGVSEPGILEQPIEQGGLAGAEKAREHGERQRRPWTARAFARVGRHHRAADLGFASFGRGCGRGIRSSAVLDNVAASGFPAASALAADWPDFAARRTACRLASAAATFGPFGGPMYTTTGSIETPGLLVSMPGLALPRRFESMSA